MQELFITYSKTYQHHLEAWEHSSSIASSVICFSTIVAVVASTTTIAAVTGAG